VVSFDTQIGGRTMSAIRRGIPVVLNNSSRTIALPEEFFPVTLLVCARTATNYSTSLECLLLKGRLKAISWCPGSHHRRGLWSPGQKYPISRQLPRYRTIQAEFRQTMTLSGLASCQKTTICVDPQRVKLRNCVYTRKSYT